MLALFVLLGPRIQGPHEIHEEEQIGDCLMLRLMSLAKEGSRSSRHLMFEPEKSPNISKQIVRSNLKMQAVIISECAVKLEM